MNHCISISKTYRRLRDHADRFLHAHYPNVRHTARKFKRIIKYMISGSIGALVHLTILFVLTDVFGVWYIASSLSGFSAAFLLSFTLQKFWTFRDSDLSKLRRQLLVYGSVAGINFILNPLLLAFFVEVVDVWYFLAQMVVMGLLAAGSYFIHKTVTFKKSPQLSEQHITVRDV